MAELLLVGGPLDGEYRDIDPLRRFQTFEWELETVERDWDGTTVYVTRVGIATYRRDGDRFTWCRTPTAIGDHTNLGFPFECQLTWEDDHHGRTDG